MVYRIRSYSELLGMTVKAKPHYSGGRLRGHCSSHSQHSEESANFANQEATGIVSPDPPHVSHTLSHQSGCLFPYLTQFQICFIQMPLMGKA